MSPSALDRKIYFSLVLVESVKNFCRPKSCKNFASKSLWITDFFSKGNFPISMTFLLFWGKWLDKSCWLSMIFTSYWWKMSGRVRTSNQYSNHGFFMKKMIKTDIVPRIVHCLFYLWPFLLQKYLCIPIPKLL